MHPKFRDAFPETRGGFGFHRHPSRELSDHLLNDIGLSRSRIAAAVYVPGARRRRRRGMRRPFAGLLALMACAILAVG